MRTRGNAVNYQPINHFSDIVAWKAGREVRKKSIYQVLLAMTEKCAKLLNGYISMLQIFYSLNRGAIGLDGDAKAPAACRGSGGSLNNRENTTANNELALAA